MNTVDIRDIEADQRLYWTISIPVTIAVLALAFVYGYKGDEIGDWIHDKILLRKTRWQDMELPKALGPTKTMVDLASLGDTQVKRPMTEVGPRAKEVWRTVRGSVRYRKRRADPEALRRSTFQSEI
jgi:hypothetical protein